VAAFVVFLQPGGGYNTVVARHSNPFFLLLPRLQGQKIEKTGKRIVESERSFMPWPSLLGHAPNHNENKCHYNNYNNHHPHHLLTISTTA